MDRARLTPAAASEESVGEAHLTARDLDTGALVLDIPIDRRNRSYDTGSAWLHVVNDSQAIVQVTWIVRR